MGVDHVSPWKRKIFARIIFDRTDIDADELICFARSRWPGWPMLALRYLFEPFWQMKTGVGAKWLTESVGL